LCAAAFSVAGACDEGRHVHVHCGYDLPGWTDPRDGLPTHRTINLVRLDGCQLSWNRANISLAMLSSKLSKAQKLSPEPVIVLDVQHASDCSYAASVAEYLHDRTRCDETGLCARGRTEDWRRAAPLGDLHWGK
jgi:hypothetical protein